MNSDKIQEKIYKGYGKAASYIGKSYTLYRPISPRKPLDPGNIVTTDIPMSIHQEPTFMKPNKYGNSVWLAIINGNFTKPGDYLDDGEGGRYFINAMPRTLPITVVECNAVFTVVRPSQAAGIGKMAYGADIKANEVVLMEDWPGNKIIGPKWEKNPVGLPSDERSPWFVILMPVWEGVELRTSDILIDEHNRRYAISNAEHSDLGWRVSAGFVGA